MDGNFIKIKKLFKYKSFLWIGIFFSLYMLIMIGDAYPVTLFNREIGQALLSGIDVSSRISTVMLKGFLFLPMLIISVYLTIPKFIKNKMIFYISKLNHKNLVLFTALSLFLLFNSYNGVKFTLLCIIISLFAYFVLQKKLMDIIHIKWIIVTSIPITMFLIELHRLFGGNLSGERLNFLLIFICYTTSCIALSFSTYSLEEYDKFKVRSASTPLYSAPILISIFLEICNILNQYNIIVINKTVYTTVIFIFCISLFFKRYYFTSDKLYDDGKYVQWQYPMLILGIAMLAFQPSMQISPAPEFFEASNHGSAIFGMFNFSEIPIIQNLDAHMLSLEIGRILYGLLNNDKFGAIFFEYTMTPAVYLLLYYFFFAILNDRFLSLILTITFPMVFFAGYEMSYGMGILLWLVSLWVYKNRSTSSFIILYSLCILMFFYRLDIGFSVAFSSAFTLLLFTCYMENNKHLIFKNLFSAFIVLVIFLFLWSFLCIYANIPPVSRTIEFLDIFSSNTRWAYASIIGSFSKTTYYTIYLIMPFIVSVISIYIYNKKSNTKSTSIFIYSMVSMAYFLNFQRSLVRHGMCEGSLITISMVLPFFVFSFCIGCYIISNYSKKLFVFLLSTFLLLIQMFSSNLNILGTSILNMYIKEALSSSAYTVYKDKVDRVVVSEEMKNRYELLKHFFDSTLEQNETFWDYSHQTLLYALTNRQKPMYTNQSPSFLSGEYSQLMYLEEIKSNNCPYAIMRSYNDGFDGVPSSVVHYLTSEYLYRNYRPLCRVLEYQIWVRHDRYLEKKDKLTNLASSQFQPLTLTDKYLSSMLFMHTKATKERDYLRLESTAADPGVLGLENNLSLKDALSKGKGISFKIQYSSSLPDGIFQCFYTLSKDDNFSEDKSVKIETRNEGIFEFFVPSSKHTKLRFDIPDGSHFTIKNLSFYIGKHSKHTIELSKITDNLIDYSCDGPTHTYNIGELPFIWGTYDKAKPQPVLTEVTPGGSFGAASLDLKSGNYIEIKTNSISHGKGVLTILREDRTPAIVVNFNVHAGEHKYLVRISWDSFWHSGQSNLIFFNCDKSVKNTSLRVLKGDTNLNKLENFALGIFVEKYNSN